MTTSTGAPTSRAVAPRRLLSIALLASMALNVLVLGAAAAAIMRFTQAPDLPPGVTGNLIGYAAALPAPRRDEIWRATEDERKRMRPLRSEVRAARIELRDVLVAEPFDRDRFARAQARLLDAETKARVEAQTLFLRIASELTPDERAAFVKWKPSRGRGWWRGRGDRQPADANPKGAASPN